MFKMITTAAALSLAASTASAAVIDAFELDVTTAAGTESSAILADGQTYRLTVSGTFRIGSNPTRHIADAEFFNLGSSPFAPLNLRGVGVDGVDVELGAYNPDNLYSGLITGDGSTISVFFQDSNYRDNTGSLSVQISSVPLPAGAALLLTALGGMGLARRRAA